MKNFEHFLNKINEEVFNTEKETKLKSYEQKVQEYNAKKTKFTNIFTNDEARWEELAEKIIDGNTYLSSAWKIEKIKHNITKLEDKLRSAELTDDEKSGVEEQLKDNEDQIKNQQKELDEKIRLDLNDINSL